MADGTNPWSPATARHVGLPRRLVDGRDKVTGTTRYAADLALPGRLLHARIVPSVYAHAWIRGVDGADALALPGVVAVLTARDLPLVGHGSARRFEPLARTEAVFAGQPVALVIAETDAAARDGAELVIVDLEPLPAVVDVVAAVAPGAPLARLTPADDAEPDAEPVEPGSGGNVLDHRRVRRGDPAAAFGRCAAVVEGRFQAAWAYQGYLEPHVATAWTDPDGTLVVSTSTQSTFDTRNSLASLYGLPSSKVRVIAPPIGGAFGSKQVVIEPMVAGAALRLGAAVRLVLERREDMAATNPSQGMIVELRLGAARSGRIEALEAHVTYDAGAYGDESWEWFAERLVTGPYRVPALDVEATGVRTNRFNAGNYRAPTGPQGVFALESLVDELAERLDLDPVALRSVNVAAAGDPMANGHPWPPTGVHECLEQLAVHPLWVARGELPPGESVGLAIGVWAGSAKPAAATCRLEPDGTLSVVTGIVDLSGVTSTLAALAAETFGLPMDAVTVVRADTSTAPASPATNASAITYAVGPAVIAAAAEARDRLLRVAAGDLEIEPRDLEIVDGVVRPRDAHALGRTVAEYALELSEAFSSPYPPVEGHASVAHTTTAPSAVGHLAHVRVDAATGEVALLGYVVVQDAGRALNPALVEGQMRGATVQSIGRALYEALVHDDQGQLLSGTFLDYAMPRAAMLPPIETLIVEVPSAEGPFGAKGIAEASIVPGPAAIANAIAAATGVRMREIPMTAERIWAAMRTAGGAG